MAVLSGVPQLPCGAREAARPARASRVAGASGESDGVARPQRGQRPGPVNLPGQGAQLVAAALVEQVAALLVPRAEHDALHGATLDQRIVHGRPMGMAMD